MARQFITALAREFDPFIFVMVMATGISSNLLYSFPYEGEWLRRCSYPMFAVACLIFVYGQFLQFIHMCVYIQSHSVRQYFNEYFRNLSHNVFWGSYPMGFATIINYIVNLAIYHTKSPIVARRLMRLVYIFWWYDVAASLLCAWGISFLIWQKYYYPGFEGEGQALNEKMARENLTTTLLLLVIPLVVAASSSGMFVMTDLFTATFNRNIQLMTMTVTVLIWFHAVIFVFMLICIYFWSLYVNKIPGMLQVFTMFLLLGPMGQASFGVLLIGENVKSYTERYYPLGSVVTPAELLKLVVPWCFKVFALLSALALLSMGYFFTILTFLTISAYGNVQVRITVGDRRVTKRIYHFHKGWFSMTFPMGTMSLGSSHVYAFYHDYVPLSAFRVIGAIYAVVCVTWCLICLMGTFYVSILPKLALLQQNHYSISEPSSRSECTSLTEVKSHVEPVRSPVRALSTSLSTALPR